MKLHRLIGILTTLQQKGTVTMPYLAEKFEVSRRTVARDIEALCAAGIPIVSVQGRGGGISIMEGFSVDTTVFSEEELASVFASLTSLDSVSKQKMSGILSGKFGTDVPEPAISIDLGAFHTDSLSEKIELLNTAIRAHRCISFLYFYEKGTDEKVIEPQKIVYRWSAWYSFGYCPARKDFRLYKLDRMSSLRILDDTFIPREIPPEKLEFGSNMTDHLRISAVYAPQAAYRIIESYGFRNDMVMKEDGLHAEIGFSSYEQALSWFLSFGAQVRITGPDEFLDRYLAELQKISRIYHDRT